MCLNIELTFQNSMLKLKEIKLLKTLKKNLRL